ncbi:MAG: 3-hydroxyisobutyrate dehydrogenase, partial [Caballeronia sp.]|nr:3-hydroxyisobutyrate dehydrogenase [Caballeronia sp.]
MNQSASKPVIGFIGLGIMGASMAARIAAAGYPLHVYNRTRAKAEPLIEAGAH